MNHPLVPRPRPPRSRSYRLGSSQSSSIGATDATNSLSASGDSKPTLSVRPNASRVALIGALETLTPPATPPLGLTPAEEQLHGLEMFMDGSRGFGNAITDDISRGSITQVQRESRNVHTAEELERLLAEARRTIDERERELGIAASIGKSLLDSNIALRSKQDALFRRVRDHADEEPARPSGTSPASSPTTVKGQERAFPPPILKFSDLHVPKAYGAHGELVESRPPPSPRNVLGRNTLRNSSGSKGDISTLFARKRTASNASASSLHSVASETSTTRCDATNRPFEIPFVKSRGHHRRSSSSSIPGHVESASGFSPLSRSSSTRSIAELHHANVAHQRHLSEQIQRLQLSEQNAELESRLQELEYEVSRADATGRKKLRRLDKELMGLKKELEDALERNRELEDKLDRRQGSKGVSSARHEHNPPSYISPEVHIRADSADAEDVDSQQTTAACMPTDTDIDTDVIIATHKGNGNTSGNSPRLGSGAQQGDAITLGPETFAAGQIVSQLLAKIDELQEANSQISARKEALNAELEAASSQFDDMRRKYEFLEERVIEAEIRNHRILELEDGEALSETALLAIQWHHHEGLTSDQPNSISPATKIKRKAVGNRPRIEQHRRLSSLYGSQLQSDQSLDSTMNNLSPPRRGTAGPNNSRNVTPLRNESTRELPYSSSSEYSRLSASPTRACSPKARSRAGSLFDADTAQDAIVSKQRQLQPDREVLEEGHSEDDVSTQSRNRPFVADNVFVTQQELPLASDTRKETNLAMQGHEAANYRPVLISQHLSTVSSESNKQGTSPLRMVRDQSTSALSVYSGPRTACTAEQLSDEEEYLGGLLPDGPADAQTYDDLHLVLQDLAVPWQDDSTGTKREAVKRIEGSVTSRSTRCTTSPWTFDDEDSDNSENDPWKEEPTSHAAIESIEQVQTRDKAEARATRRRKRIEDLARQMLEDQDMDPVAGLESCLALVKVNSISSKCAGLALSRSNSSLSTDASEYEEVETANPPSGREPDYWPVAHKARSTPAVVAMRVQRTTGEYVSMCLLWAKFLVVLAVAVVFSIWRGPEAGLGIRGRTRKRLQPSASGSKGSVVLRRASTSEK